MVVDDLGTVVEAVDVVVEGTEVRVGRELVVLVATVDAMVDELGVGGDVTGEGAVVEVVVVRGTVGGVLGTSV